VVGICARLKFDAEKPALEGEPFQIRPARVFSERSLISPSQIWRALPDLACLPWKDRRIVSDDAIAAIRAALESAGIIFTDANGNGPGVRLGDRK
jgi:hypothetical protein